MKFHVHIYKITGKAEIEVEAKDDEEARKMALKKKLELKFDKSDCEFIAIAFPCHVAQVRVGKRIRTIPPL